MGNGLKWAGCALPLLASCILFSGCDAKLSSPSESDIGVHDASSDARALDAAASDAAHSDAGRDASSSLDAGNPLDPDPSGTWRSALFPRDWQPVHEGASPDSEDRFLPDFSYAGWHRGEARPPIGEDLGTVRTVDAALGNGTTDATSAIQNAINTACQNGGGIVHIPAGTYRVRLPSANATTVLNITCSNLVIRGDGASTRILFDDARRARDVTVISVRGPGSIYDNANTTTWALAEDSNAETRTLSLSSAPALAVGDWVIVRNENTTGFRAEHRMDEATSGEANLWPTSGFQGLTYLRQVVAKNGNSLELDAPIRYRMRVRDRARVYKAPAFYSEIGLESFAIGMVQNSTNLAATEAQQEQQFNTEGTAAYEVHNSRAIDFDRVRDAWIWDVDSFMPSGNTSMAHVLSIGLQITKAASRITIGECDIGRPQYRGAGGNGYLFHIQGSDVLVRNSSASDARHGFTLNHAVSGSVFRDVTIRRTRLGDDSHRFLSHANLYDGVVLDNAWLTFVNRGTASTGAGFTATQHVFWRTQVENNHNGTDGCAVESAQWGHGYLIGSSSRTGETAKLCPSSFSNDGWAMLDQGTPTDFVEGENIGATLYPPSLHAAQLARRCAREGLNCNW